MENMSKNTFSIWIRLMEFGNRLGCHQMPDRSFFIKGFQFPVCARCTGVIIGEIVALISFIFKCHISFLYSLFLLIPMGIDWGLQYFKICMSNNIRRLVTGILSGLALTNIYYDLLLLTYKAVISLTCK